MQVSEIRLNPGLYLCHLQAESSIDSLRVIVSSTSPSVLPYTRVRENSHVTCDEWSWINKMGALLSGGKGDGSAESSMQAPSPTTNFLAGALFILLYENNGREMPRLFSPSAAVPVFDFVGIFFTTWAGRRCETAIRMRHGIAKEGNAFDKCRAIIIH